MGDPVLDLWLKRRRVNERELARLNASWSGPRVDLPLLALERGSELAETLGFVLRDGLEAGLSWDGPSAGVDSLWWSAAAEWARPRWRAGVG